jgi:hypothetical protein
MTPVASVGYLAAGLVFATFCTKHMVQLRALAIASNIAFIGYGYLGKLWPILILHAAMLPMNTHRLRQEIRRPAPAPTARAGHDESMVAQIAGSKTLPDNAVVQIV